MKLKKNGFALKMKMFTKKLLFFQVLSNEALVKILLNCHHSDFQ